MSMSDIVKTFGSRVKQRRLQLGLTQEDLAKKVGLSGRSTVNKWGKDQNGITQDKIVILANALDVRESAFLLFHTSLYFCDIIKNLGNKKKTARNYPHGQFLVCNLLKNLIFKQTISFFKVCYAKFDIKF